MKLVRSAEIEGERAAARFVEPTAQNRIVQAPNLAAVAVAAVVVAAATTHCAARRG